MAKRKKAEAKLVFGFTMIELIVVIGIFALLSGVILGNYHGFNAMASLDNLTHQVALLVRQAQVYGISVSQGNIYKGYGVYFSTATPADQKLFILFNDHSPQDNKYNSGVSSPCDGSDECIQKITIQTADIISSIRAKEKTDPSNAITLKEAHIVFTRPNPDANNLGIDYSNNQFDKLADIEIYLLSPKGVTKKVVVWSTGQVAVE